MSGADPALPELPTWSCVTCKERKVRCDREQPCFHCARTGTECIFPTAGRIPRRKHNSDPVGQYRRKQEQLTARVKALESVVEELTSQLQIASRVPKESILWTSPAGSDHPAENLLGKSSTIDTCYSIILPVGLHRSNSEIAALVFNKNETLYIGSAFWACLYKAVGAISLL